MTSSEPRFPNLGAPVQIDPARIEHELRSLWRNAKEQSAEVPLVRACSCNLVVLVGSGEEASDVLPVLARIAESHPSRSVVAFSEESGEESGVRAWISAQCALSARGTSQICSETITLAAATNAIGHLRNMILSLLVPDLPVYLYRRSALPQQDLLLQSLAPLSRLVLVDSRAAHSQEERRRLLSLLSHSPGGRPVRDLDWGRLTAWRDLIAQFFDSRPARPMAKDIARVVIRRRAIPGAPPYRTLLLLAWLADRLKWRRTSVSRADHGWDSTWRSETGEVHVRLEDEPCGTDDGSAICSVQILTRRGNEFRVIREPDSSCMKAYSSSPGIEVAHSALRGSMDEASLISDELNLPAEESAFETILAAGMELAEAFARS